MLRRLDRKGDAEAASAAVDCSTWNQTTAPTFRIPLHGAGVRLVYLRQQSGDLLIKSENSDAYGHLLHGMLGDVDRSELPPLWVQVPRHLRRPPDLVSGVALPLSAQTPWHPFADFNVDLTANEATYVPKSTCSLEAPKRAARIQHLAAASCVDKHCLQRSACQSKQRTLCVSSLVHICAYFFGIYVPTNSSKRA